MNENVIPLRKRRHDWFFIGFFLLNLFFITYVVDLEQLIIPDEIHDFLRWSSWVRAYSATEEFFDRTLKRGEKIATDR